MTPAINNDDLCLQQPTESNLLFPKYSNDDKSKTIVFKWCRIAGVLYALIIGCGIYADVGVRGRFINFSSAAETAFNIETYALQFRSTILFELVMCVSDICVAILLSSILYFSINSGEKDMIYQTNHMNENIKIVLMALFRLIQTTIIAYNLLHSFAASLILDKSFADVTAAGIGLESIILNGYDSDGEKAIPVLAENLALLFLSIQKYGYTLALVFFGMSLVLLGIIMIWRENALVQFPKMLGLFCILAGIGYILDAVMYFSWTSYDGQVSGFLMLPVFIAEFWLTGWLLSVKVKDTDAAVVVQ